MAATRPDVDAPAARDPGRARARPASAGCRSTRSAALAMDAVQKANAGHPGTAMALAPLGYTLFKRFLRANPRDPSWPDRDRFVLSAGPRLRAAVRAAPPRAATTSALEDLEQFRQWGSRTPGHPERGHTPGIEVTTGPLGQGVANAVGMAIAERFLAERFNRPGQRDRRPPHLRDLLRRRHDGGRQPGGRVDRRALRPRQADRLLRRQPHHDRRHDRDLLRRREPRRADGRPTAGTCSASRTPRTSTRSRRALHGRARGNGAAVVHLDPLAHRLPGAATRSTPPSRTARRSARRKCARTKEAMGFDPDKHFWVDERVYEHMSLRERGRGAEQERWSERFAPGARRYPEMADDWDRAWAGRLRDGWREALPTLRGRRAASPRARPGRRRWPAFAEYAPTMIGGAADLVESTKTVFEGAGRVLARARRAQRPVRDPRARDGRDRQRRRRARRHRQAVRLDVPDLLRLHARRRCGCRR